VGYIVRTSLYKKEFLEDISYTLERNLSEPGGQMGGDSGGLYVKLIVTLEF
jgi:hypothetical protein